MSNIDASPRLRELSPLFALLICRSVPLSTRFTPSGVPASCQRCVSSPCLTYRSGCCGSYRVRVLSCSRDRTGTGPFVIALAQDPARAMDTFEFLPSPEDQLTISST